MNDPIAVALGRRKDMQNIGTTSRRRTSQNTRLEIFAGSHATAGDVGRGLVWEIIGTGVASTGVGRGVARTLEDAVGPGASVGLGVGADVLATDVGAGSA